MADIGIKIGLEGVQQAQAGLRGLQDSLGGLGTKVETVRGAL